MDFRRINTADKQIIDDFQRRYECNGSTYSLAYLASWKYFDFEHMDIGYDDESLVLRFSYNGTNRYLAQLTAKQHFHELVDEILEADPSGIIVQVESEYAAMIDDKKYKIINRIEEAEYLYAPQDLITLAGKKYHGKRNHVKRFEKAYPDYVYRDYEPSDKDALMALYDEWEEGKDPEMLADLTSERAVITKMLDNMELYDLKTAIIEVDGRLVGYTIGEITASNIGVVHIEKGDTDYEGIYPIINKLFATQHFGGVRYINRQEDMGLDGLRRAKRSYYPVRMSEKCSIQRF